MNILVFSTNAWDNANSIGNTISNFFEGKTWQNDTFYNIYMRNALPDNNVCENYYQMTVTDIIKHHFDKEEIGKEFKFKERNTGKGIVNEKERKYIDIIHKYSLNFAYIFADYFQRRKKWINDNFKNYIKKSNPDIFFSFVTNVSMLKPIVEYVKNNTSAKIVLFISDNIYGSYENKTFFVRKKLEKEFKEIIDMADQLYGASNELCEEYGKIFNKVISPLYKGCIFNEPMKDKINEPIKFVYAGNLFYGREEILSKIGQPINPINEKGGQKAILEIYTGATVTKELEKKLNIKNSSIIMGKKSYDEIRKIINEAEYSIHVESFEPKQIDYVKYSFSTKIIDCLQSGSCFVGIGPDCISSIKYIKRIPGSFVIDKIDDIEKKIEYLIKNKNNVLSNSRLIRKYAQENHDSEINQIKLRNTFVSLKNS